jgi:hypothetical protein
LHCLVFRFKCSAKLIARSNTQYHINKNCAPKG